MEEARSLGEAPCAYLQRGIALAETRSAVLAGKGLGRNNKVYLQGLAQGSDPQLSAWAKLVLARVAAGSPVGLAPPAEER